MKLIVGLGNPGPEYVSTRHNTGFMVLDLLGQEAAGAKPRTRFHALTVDFRLGSEQVLLMKPQTFMNLSGQAVGEAVGFHQLPVHDLLVVVDDTALALGTLRLRPCGGCGGHNGLADIGRALGTEEYPRLRVGVGAPEVAGHRIDQADYVLGGFRKDELEILTPALKLAADTCLRWADQGIDAAMNHCNKPPSDGPDDPKRHGESKGVQ